MILDDHCEEAGFVLTHGRKLLGLGYLCLRECQLFVTILGTIRMAVISLARLTINILAPERWLK